MKKHRREMFLALSNITQLGLNIVISFLIWIMIASWARKTFHLSNFVMVIGILAGVGSAILSFIKFYKEVIKENKNEK